ncbi:hypothetical protein [Rummeliibacillus pycnus]|uniref:hypothetical protein n=1 Tax=Rummeliibacillus pycnus TaxID=101070 RepID=UPI000C9A9209|nr:hypothetical protein [Rummeliibacillus pycnus]
MKNKFRYLTSYVILLIVIFSTVGCSQSVHSGQETTVKVEYNEDGDNKSIQSIAHVLKTEFTSPKQKYNDILKNPNNILKINGKKVLKASSGSELYQYIEDLYQPYFTNNGFEKFFVGSAFSYTLQSKDIQIKVDNISIKKNKDDQKNYDFVVNVKYKKVGGPEKKYKIKGLATLPEEGKIADITYLDDSGLKEKIEKNS